jgi:hypothetical protein
LWAELAHEDGRRAFQAIRTLMAASPALVVDFLRREMLHLPRLDSRQMDRWIAELDSTEFTDRQKATAELEKLGALAERPLREALQNQPSPEARQRIEALLTKLKDRPVTPERVRLWRLVEVLEHLVTPDARRLLEKLADETPDAQLSLEAKASLQRFSQRTPARP